MTAPKAKPSARGRKTPETTSADTKQAPARSADAADKCKSLHACHLARVYAVTIDDFHQVKQLEASLYKPWRRAVAAACSALSTAILDARAVLALPLQKGLCSETEAEAGVDASGSTPQQEHMEKKGRGRPATRKTAELTVTDRQRGSKRQRSSSSSGGNDNNNTSTNVAPLVGGLSSSFSSAARPCHAYARLAATFVAALRRCWADDRRAPSVFAALPAEEYPLHDVVCVAAALDTLAVLLLQAPPPPSVPPSQSSTSTGNGGGDISPKSSSSQSSPPSLPAQSLAARNRCPTWPKGGASGWWAEATSTTSHQEVDKVVLASTAKGGKRRSSSADVRLAGAESVTPIPAAAPLIAPIPVGTAALSELPSLPPSAITVLSALPCERFDDAAVLWARCEATLRPAAMGPIAEAVGAAAEVVRALMVVVGNSSAASSASAAAPDEVGGGYITSRSRARAQQREEQLAAFGAAAEASLAAFDLLVKQRLMPLRAVAEAFLSASTAAASASSTAFSFASLCAPPASEEAAAMELAAADTLNLFGVAAHAGVVTPSPSFSSPFSQQQQQQQNDFLCVPLSQPVAFESLHFAPLSPPPATVDVNADGNTSYSFQSIVNATPNHHRRAAGALPPSFTAAEAEAEAAAADNGAGRGGGRQPRRAAMRGKAAAVLKSSASPSVSYSHPSPFASLVGPHVPQCYIGAFLGFPLLVREMRRRMGHVGATADEGTRDALSSSSSPSLNGPVIVLGMGGNVCLNLLAEQLLAPTPEGSAFLEANPLFSLHVVELEPAVVRTCGLSGLLPGYEAVPAAVDRIANGGGLLQELATATMRPASYAVSASSTPCIEGCSAADAQPPLFPVRRSKHLPAWALPLLAARREIGSTPRHSSSSSSPGEAFSSYAATVQHRVFYHVGIDAMATDLRALVGQSVLARWGRTAAGNANEAPLTANANVTSAVKTRSKAKVSVNRKRVGEEGGTDEGGIQWPGAELLLLDCFDPLMAQMGDPAAVLARLRAALSPTGVLCTNAHMAPADLNGPSAAELRRKEKEAKEKEKKQKRASSSPHGSSASTLAAAPKPYSNPLAPFVDAFVDDGAYHATVLAREASVLSSAGEAKTEGKAKAARGRGAAAKRGRDGEGDDEEEAEEKKKEAVESADASINAAAEDARRRVGSVGSVHALQFNSLSQFFVVTAAPTPPTRPENAVGKASTMADLPSGGAPKASTASSQQASLLTVLGDFVSSPLTARLLGHFGPALPSAHASSSPLPALSSTPLRSPPPPRAFSSKSSSATVASGGGVPMGDAWAVLRGWGVTRLTDISVPIANAAGTAATSELGATAREGGSRRREVAPSSSFYTVPVWCA